MEQTNGDILYAITNDGQRYTTNPFLLIDKSTELTTNEDGQLVVPIKQDIEDFSDAAQAVVEDAAQAVGESASELAEDVTLFIVGDALDAL